MIAAPWPFYDVDEREAAMRPLEIGKTNYWTGCEGRHFEEEYAEYFRTRHAVALANGTLALELAFEALGLQPGDDVIVTPRTFLASASAAVARGLRPVFADVDLDSGNATAETIARALTPKTKAVVCVHLAGWPCDMPAIMDLAQSEGLKVVEDCAQSHGATIDGRFAGSFGHASAWSFCQDKIMSSGGEGGMLTTDDDAVWRRAWAYKDHGKSFEAVHAKDHAPGFRWLHDSFGTNWRLTESQSAIGRVQLRKLHAWVSTRRDHAHRLIEAMRPYSAVRVPIPREGVEHAYYRLYAYVRPENLNEGWSRDRIMAELNATGVPCFVGSCPEIYRERAFEARGWRQERLPVACELGETSLCFLVHPTYTTEQIDEIGRRVATVLSNASRSRTRRVGRRLDTSLRTSRSRDLCPSNA